MKYYINKSVKGLSFEQAIDKVTKALKDEGFGILTEIDIKATLKNKLDVDFRPYIFWVLAIRLMRTKYSNQRVL
ncbi:MAG: DUF302 domain-containing protein [Reichenbachiella sp.]|uniref:DUF302 domain-containing protein n=1 Tax=Reichenbachiella sp. TaxID=2184521 RepID=UPI0029663F63|nr:DUF302 domain-containing protein [Reichenbachiella sp.]MDW3212147.1 DUF302 domain-containing protein [Reichenbachiella sp.]